MSQERIVAVGLLTGDDVKRLGETFTRLWPIDEVPCFEDLLEAIDEADRHLQAENRTQGGPMKGPSLKSS